MNASTSSSKQPSADLRQQIVAIESEFKRNPEQHVDRLAELYLANGQAKDAVRVLEKHQNGKDVERRLLLAQAWFDSLDSKRSFAILKEVTQTSKIDGNLRAQLLLGEIAFDEGRHDEARLYLKQARKLDPNNRRAAELLAKMGEKVELPKAQPTGPSPWGEFKIGGGPRETAPRAIAHIVAGLIIGTIAVSVYYYRAKQEFTSKELALEAGRLARNADIGSLNQAELKYLEALTYRDDNAWAISGLAEVHALLWADHGIEESQAKANEWLAKARADEIEKPERFAAEMLMAFGEKRFDDAEALAAKLIEKGGVSDKLFYSLGRAQVAMGKIKLGRENLRRSTELRADAAHYQTALADAHFDDGEDNNALFFWNRAREQNKNYIKGAARSAFARARRGLNPVEILEEVKQLEATPAELLGKADRAAIAMAKSAVLSRLNKTAEAVAAADEAVRIEGETGMALWTRAQALLDDGKTPEGIAALEAARTQGRGGLRYLFDLAATYLLNNQVDQALAALQQEAGRLAELPFYHVALGNALRAKQKWTEALASYDEALKLHDEYADATLGRGMVFYEQKKYEEATSEFERAVEARKNFPDVFVSVGIMWVDTNHAGQGQTQLEHAEKLLKSQGANRRAMERFYGQVLAAFGRAKGGSSYVKQWTERRDAYRKNQE